MSAAALAAIIIAVIAAAIPAVVAMVVTAPPRRTDPAGALATMLEAARAEGEAAGRAAERAAVVAYLREPAWATDVAGGIERGEHVGAAGGAR